MICFLPVVLKKEARKGLFSFEIAWLDDSQGNDRRGRSSAEAALPIISLNACSGPHNGRFSARGAERLLSSPGKADTDPK